MLTCRTHTLNFPKWWLKVDWSLRHFQLCPGFSAMPQCRLPHLPWKEHGMSWFLLPWKFQVIYSALNYCSYWILVYISLRSMQAQSLIFFFNAQDLTLGEEKEYSQIPICISFIWVFLALDPPLWPSVYVLQAPGPAAASVTLSLLLWVVQLLWFHS